MHMSGLSNNMISTKSLMFVALILSLSVLIHLMGHPHPENFDQPMKYRLLAIGAEFLNYFGLVLESFNFGHRLDLTRFGYHWSIGAFSIRDPADGIQIIDEEVEHCSMRIFRPMNQSIAATIPTIIYYHGGGHFVGSAG